MTTAILCRQIDVETMRQLHDKVNVIPVIGKADTLTKEELEVFKDRVRQELVEAGIQAYSFPSSSCPPGPYAMIGSDTVVTVHGRAVRARSYPWGVVDIEDPAHCDFSLLRRLLLAEYTQHLVDRTREDLYENFR